MKSELFPPYAVLLSLASLCSARSFFTRMFALPVLAGATVLVVATGAGVAAGATVPVAAEAKSNQSKSTGAARAV